jgi:outer membrane protein assembly factor BamB
MKRILLLILAAWSLAALSTRADDWIPWRGPEQTGFSRDTNLPAKWSPAKPGENNLIWSQPYGGRSTPLVMNGRVYLINDAGEGLNEQERVMCFDAATGKVLWQHRFNVFFTDVVSARVGWACLAGDRETGNVYAHGVQGLFFCFDKDGKVLWQHSLTEEYGRISGYGGRVNSPIVDGDLVIMGMVNASWGDQTRGGNRFLAMDKRTGTPVWWSQPTEGVRGTYSSIPVVEVINGQRQLITGTSDGYLAGLQIQTGKPLWSYPAGAKSMNISPVVEGTRVYIGHGEENLDNTEQGRVVCVDAGKVKDGKPELVWKVDGLTIKYTSPLIHEGRLYVCDDSARMYCLDAATGKEFWKYKYGRSAVASPVLADGKIYVGEVGARFHILKLGTKKPDELSSQFFRSHESTTAVEINGSCAVADGRVYFMTSEAIYCFGNPSRQGVATATARDRDLAAAQAGDATPGQLLVYPADVVLEPGQSVHFKVRAYDANGYFLREVKADSWSLPTPTPPPNAKTSPPPLKGTITPDGKLTVDKTPPGQGGTVLAKVGGLSARARVRVVPPLPIRQNFANIPVGAIPGGWVNVAGKFTVVEKDGAKALKKLANNSNPLLARAKAFFGMPNLIDYTIQADMLGTRKGEDLPDMGILANRYRLFLDGNKQRLRLVSWEANQRVDKTIDFAWKPDVWLRMKLTVAVQGPQAVIRGKVWPRDDKEPANWTVEFTDPTPNREGSPGLYAYATGIIGNEPGAEVFFTNVSVTPNDKKAAAK